jgi:hypothetical protein
MPSRHSFVKRGIVDELGGRQVIRHQRALASDTGIKHNRHYLRGFARYLRKIELKDPGPPMLSGIVTNLHPHDAEPVCGTSAKSSPRERAEEYTEDDRAAACGCAVRRKDEAKHTWDSRIADPPDGGVIKLTARHGGSRPPVWLAVWP